MTIKTREEINHKAKVYRAIRDLRKLPPLLAMLEKDFTFLFGEIASGEKLGVINYLITADVADRAEETADRLRRLRDARCKAT